ncbi:MAG TPA: ABC transporter permease subunit, partial [Myxococcota bacterium]|nr:ABC transporter permease subunit [Myxococcota bacterium]
MPATNNYERPLFRGRAPFSIYDLPIALAVFGLIWAVLTVGRDMTSPVLPESGEFDLSYLKLPYYALRSVFRMFVAYIASLVFTFIFGSLAAHNKTAEKIIIPTVDILQSVPILGFLAVTVNGFMALFPGSIMGIELASIFAIFTSMVWNLVYSFFQSVRTIPQELLESSKVYRLSSMQRFVRLEVPSAMIGLVWNSMVSFGGGWFFLAASEAITVLNKDIRLPGLGSYMATAVEQGDIARVFAAIAVMLAIVVSLDLIFFRPLLAWAQKFSSGESLDSDAESNVLTALQRSTLIERFQEHVSKPMWSLLIDQIPARIGRIRHSPTYVGRRRRISWIGILLLVAGAAALLYKVGDGILYLVNSLTAREFGVICLAGLATMGRVLATVLLASLVWVPIGTYIGTRPALARRIRPIIQIGAAFPANLVYPLLVALFVAAGVGLGVGSIVLMFVATQWYILFNV